LVEHLTQKQVKDYCQQRLSVAELLSVSDHLDECEACRRRVESALSCDVALLALRAEIFSEASENSSAQAAHAHLTAEQTAEYVDKRLSGEEFQTVTDHLSRCEQCVLAVEDLDAFRHQVAPSLEHEYRPATSRPRTEGWWRRTFASLPAVFNASPAPAFGAVMALLLLALSGWLIWNMMRDREPGRGPAQEIVVSATPASQSTPEPQPSPIDEPSPAPLVAQLNDGGGQLALNQEGELSGAGDLPPAYRKMLKEALTAPRIERSSQLKGLTRPPSSLKSTDKQGSEFFVIEPVGKVLMTDRPTFRWSPVAGATGYMVEVYDGQFNLVASSPQLTTNSWAGPKSLSRGQVYSWQVKAIKDGQELTSPRPPEPQAKFRILDGAKANELMKARRAYPSSHLTLGLLYAEAGLLEEAERELRLLQKANPGSEVARRLLSQIQALRRRSQ
jgi:anti-sigma factor RsiW